MEDEVRLGEMGSPRRGYTKRREKKKGCRLRSGNQRSECGDDDGPGVSSVDLCSSVIDLWFLRWICSAEPTDENEDVGGWLVVEVATCGGGRRSMWVVE